MRIHNSSRLAGDAYRRVADVASRIVFGAFETSARAVQSTVESKAAVWARRQTRNASNGGVRTSGTFLTLVVRD